VNFVILVSGVRIERAQRAADAPANEIADDRDRLQGLGQYRLAGFRSRDLVPEEYLNSVFLDGSGWC
jgi:hypothetical protein